MSVKENYAFSILQSETLGPLLLPYHFTMQKNILR
jgi:hypothetical protein